MIWHDMDEPWAGRLRWAYPGGDRFYRAATMRGVLDAFAAIERYVRGRRTVLQAGGCIGVWPLRLAQMFDRVIAVESHPENYRCLVENLAGAKNVETIHAPLGDGGKVAVHDSAKGNAGGHYVLPDRTGIRSLRIDDLGLGDCDLIQLDIEASEHAALRGAARTIELCRPMVMIEEKNWRDRPGPFDAARRYVIDAHDYREVGRTGHDRILAPK